MGRREARISEERFLPLRRTAMLVTRVGGSCRINCGKGNDMCGEKAGGYPTIKALVLDFVHRCDGDVDYDALTAEVLKDFPDSRWKRTHWSWYRNQILRGRFKEQFSRAELAAVSRSGRARTAVVPENRLRGAMQPKPATNPQTDASDEPRVALVSQDMLDAISKAIHAARAYEHAAEGHRKLGITGEVGEVLCCHLLGLKLCVDPRSEGFDAMDSGGRRVQIKTRRSESDGLPRDVGRLSTFSRHEFDYALLVLLDPEYSVAEIWRAEYIDIAGLIESQKRRNPSLASFKRKAMRVWPAT